MESKFFKALASAKPVQTGTKASNDTVPTLTLLSLPNKFQLNKLATIAMGLTIKDRVRMFDGGREFANGERYFIAKTSQDDPISAKMGKANSSSNADANVDMTFNYAGTWASLVQVEDGAVELGAEALCEKGCVVKGETDGGRVKYRATNAIKFELEDAGDFEIAGVVYHMFALTNIKVTPKSVEELNNDLQAPAKKVANVENADSQEVADVEFEDADEDEDQI